MKNVPKWAPWAVVALIFFIMGIMYCRRTSESYSSKPPSGFVYVTNKKAGKKQYIRDFINLKDVKIDKKQMYPDYKFMAVSKNKEVFVGKELPTGSKPFTPSLKTSHVLYTYDKKFTIFDITSYGPCIPTGRNEFKDSVMVYKVDSAGKCVPAECALGRVLSGTNCIKRRQRGNGVSSATFASPSMTSMVTSSATPSMTSMVTSSATPFMSSASPTMASMLTPSATPFMSSASPTMASMLTPSATPFMSSASPPMTSAALASGGPVTIESVAATLGMTVQAFNQQLVTDGMTFEQWQDAHD